MYKSSAITAAALSTVVVMPALASDNHYCGETDHNQWLTKEVVQTKLAEQGYQVQRFKIDDGCYEAYARGDQGQQLELKIHPVSGEIVDIEDED